MISIAIMSVPSRKQNVLVLRKSLTPLRVTVFEDLNHNLWRNAFRAWLCHSEEWHMVIQDDALLCPGFVNQVQEILSTNPYKMYTFYQSHCLLPEIQQAYAEQYSFLLLNRIRGCVATLLHSSLIPDMLFFTRKILPLHPLQDDERVSDWMESAHILACLPIPELVEHTGKKSIIGAVRKNLDSFSIRRYSPHLFSRVKEIHLTTGWHWRNRVSNG